VKIRENYLAVDGATKAKTGNIKEQKSMPEDVAEIRGNRETGPRPFRIVEFGCNCSCRHFNSGECIICILAVRPGTMSPGSNGHRRVSPTVRQTCGQPFFFFLFSRRRAAGTDKRREVREEVPETDGER